MFVRIHNSRPLPGKEEVAEARSKGNGYEEIAIVSHGYKHEEVTEYDLYYM